MDGKMPEELTIQTGHGRYMIVMQGIVFSQDMSIVVYGGELPHIGACAFAYQDGREAVVQVMKAPLHKEEQLAESIARRIAAEFSCNACVAAGIHIDHATKEEIQTLVRHTDNAVELFIDEMKKRRKQYGF